MKVKNPRLQFTEAEMEDSRLKEHIRHAEKAADKAEAAREKIPKKKKQKQVQRRTIDPATGKQTVRLHFEEVEKKAPASRLRHGAAAVPGLALSGQVHKKIGETEGDNVGVESAHKVEEAAETAGRIGESAYHSHRLKPYRAAARAEKRLEKANIKALYHKSLAENPQIASNPLSRWQQKQAIKKQYAAARAGKNAAQTVKNAGNTARAAKKAAKETKEAAGFVWRHRKGFLVVIALLLVVCIFMNGLSSLTMLFQGGMSGVAGSTYPSRDSDMLGAEADYAGVVRAAQEQGTLAMLFERQYTLTERVEEETRYRTETRTGTHTYTDPETGETSSEDYEYEVEVPYDYYICYVTLTNFDLSHLPVYLMNEDQVSMYAVYMAALGNRPDLFPQGEYPNASGREDYLDYGVPPEAMEDEQFAAMLREAEKYLGYPYVWGGSNPSTSFDCSGFVSWVINHSGWDVGRQTANGLLGLCTPVSSSNAKPGDLIFFQGTYNTSGASHVGIYVGNGMMIHCGSPISYASVNTPYWQQHFYTFARLP